MNTTNGMTIAEAARVTGVTTDAIRHYVRIGLLDPERSNNGYRRLKAREVRRIRFIRRSQRLGFKLDEIRAVIHESAHGNTPCPLVRDILRRRVMDNKKALEEMLTLQNRMEAALQIWVGMPDGIPTGEVVCSLIESLDEA